MAMGLILNKKIMSSSCVFDFKKIKTKTSGARCVLNEDNNYQISLQESINKS
jgi:hypothetical protein